MTKLLIILLIGLTFEAAGVVCLNRGLKQIGEVKKISASEIFRIIKNGVTNPTLLLGVFFEAIFFVALLILMSKATVSFVWPLTSLSFVFTTVAAKFFLREEISGLRWGGVLLIMLGAAVISYSEKIAEKKTPLDNQPPSIARQ
jgi:drug/metabolite transporter (DMT)-like permease